MNYCTLIIVIDLETTQKKSSRVRSWYLYEQYKSLETSNLNAAQRQKEKSEQKEILSKELSERRARRRLCGGYPLGDSELVVDCTKDAMDLPNYDVPCRKRSHYGEENSTSVSWQSASLEDSQLIHHMRPEPFPDYDSIEVISENLYDSQLEMNKEHCSREATVDDYYETPIQLSNDMMEINNVLNSDNFKEELELVCQKTDDIKLQLENAKENLLCLENLTKYCEEDLLSEEWSSDEAEPNDVLPNYYTLGPPTGSSDNGLFLLWSRLVSFAYQIIRVSHGDVLQPYVCPIKYADDSYIGKNRKGKMRKKCHQCTRTAYDYNRNTKAECRYKKIPEPKCTRCSRHGIRKLCSDHTKYNEILNKCNHSRWSEPCKRSFKISQVSSEESDTRLRDLRCKRIDSRSRCGCRRKMINPMLKLSQYIDNLVNDVRNDNEK